MLTLNIYNNIYIDIYILTLYIIIILPETEELMLPELTKKQGLFLQFLEREIVRTGKAPSLRHAAAGLGVSHAAIVQYIKALEEKGYLKREGRYSRNLYLLNRARETKALHRWREVPIIGRCTAGLPLYAQEEWDGTLVVDHNIYRAPVLFALRVKGDSMAGAGILDGDLAICEPRQYAKNREIVVALIRGEEATIKRFFLRRERIELRPENSQHQSQFYEFGELLIQGKVIGIHRGPEQMAKI